MCLELYRLGRTLGLCPDNYVPLIQPISKHQLSCYTVSLTEKLFAVQLLMISSMKISLT